MPYPAGAAVSARDCCQLVRASYRYAGEPRATFDYTGDPSLTGFAWFIKNVNGVPLVIFPGTETLLDTIRDLEAFADPFEHGFLGPVHPGALKGMNVVAAHIRDLGVGNKCVMTGHSLGAMRADIGTGELLALGCQPLSRVVFGEPKPGFERLRTVLAPVPALSFCNGHPDSLLDYDHFTDVPARFWPELYVRPCRMTWLSQQPVAGDIWGPLAWHRIQYYDQALTQKGNS